MASRLYVYYRVPEAELGPALAAARALQAGLVARHPGLQAELLRRPPASGSDADEATVMEVYLPRHSVTPEFERDLESSAAAQSALPAARHVERFQTID